MIYFNYCPIFGLKNYTFLKQGFGGVKNKILHNHSKVSEDYKVYLKVNYNKKNYKPKKQIDVES